MQKRNIFDDVPILEKMHRLKVLAVDNRCERVTLDTGFLLWLITKTRHADNTGTWQYEGILQEYTDSAFTTYELPDAIRVLEVIIKDMAKHLGMSSNRRIDTP
jgi:hypothetical protein